MLTWRYVTFFRVTRKKNSIFRSGFCLGITLITLTICIELNKMNEEYEGQDTQKNFKDNF